MKNISFILIILFLVALLPRIYQLDKTTIYPDEISWMVRGKETLYAISKLNLDYFNSAWWTDSKGHESIALPLTLSSGASLILLGKNPSDISLQLFPDYTAARIPVAILTSLLIPSFYLLVKRFLRSGVALLFAVLLAFDPIHLALSRWVMNDGILTTFIFLTIFSFLVYQKKKLFLVLSSLTLAAACLTRPTGAITAAPLAILSLSKSNALGKSFLLLSSTLLLTYLFIWLLWPGLWGKPLISYAEYFFRQAMLAQTGIAVFFIGEVTANPPLSYYPFQLFARLPIYITILILISPFFIIKNGLGLSNIRNYLPQISFAAFVIIFLLALSFSALKIGVRYALPTWPWIYLLAAWTFGELLLIVRLRLLKIVVTLLILASALFTLVKYFPDYYLFYNSFAGGAAGAQRYDLVGHCLGTKPSLEYVTKCFSPEKSVAILGCSGVTAPYYFHKSISNNWRESDITLIDYTYKQLLSSKEVLDYFSKEKPIFTAKSNGAILSEVYSKTPVNDSCLK